MTNDQLLNLLKWILLALIYLFFARVMWAVWSEVRTPRTRVVQRTGAPAASAPTTPTGRPAPAAPASTPKKGTRRRAGRLVILEPRHRRGMAYALEGEITLGRDDNCTISIQDDGYVSQLHLRIFDHDGQPMVEDLGSTNGTYHNGSKLNGAKLLHTGDRIQVGTTIIEAQ
jgi:hypothetical protein